MRPKATPTCRPGSASLAWVVGAVLLVSSCTSRPPTTSVVPPDPNNVLPASGPQLQAMIEVLEKSADLPWSEESIQLHRDVFADGEVTYSEYERAMHAVASCVRSYGYTIEGPLYYGEGGLIVVEPGADPRWIITPYLGIAVGPGFEDDASYCQELFQRRIEQVWAASMQATEAEMQDWLDAAWECARERGIEISSPPDERVDLVNVVPPCEPWLALPQHLQRPGG